MQDRKLLSKEAKQILRQGFGWRDENLFGEGIIDFRKVLTHEEQELGNSDITETVIKLYHLQYIPSHNQIISMFQNELRTNMLYCKWLCAYKKNVLNYRITPDDHLDITKFYFKNVVVASDLGPDGCLLVSNAPIVMR